MSVAEILKEIAALNTAELGELKARIAEQFPDATEADISPELAKLLDERNAAYEADPGAAVPWETVYAESLKRTRQ